VLARREGEALAGGGRPRRRPPPWRTVTSQGGQFAASLSPQDSHGASGAARREPARDARRARRPAGRRFLCQYV